MDPPDPNKLDYSSGAEDQEDDGPIGVERYYREPPDGDSLIIAAVLAIGFLIVALVVAAYVIRDRLF